MTRPQSPQDERQPCITRRDFVNGTLVGAGSLLLQSCDWEPGSTVERSSPDPNLAWNGPSGVGAYRSSNGITWRTMEAAHRIRDRAHGDLADADDTGERYDLVIVGGGFAGLGALHAFRKEHTRGTCLLIDNQEVFGGYAKANAFEVDGHRIAGAQASLNFMLPKGPDDRGGDIWADLGLPDAFRFADREDGESAIKFAASSSAPLYYGEQSATVGYFFGEQRWVTDIWRDDLRRAPWPDAMKRALLAMRTRKREQVVEGAEAARLDAMTFAEFATRELHATPEALKYITQGMCITGPQISAYGARSFPGLEHFAAGSPQAADAERFMSFPEGNAVLARALVGTALPNAFAGGNPKLNGSGRLVPNALDQAGNACRIRLRATVVRVAALPGGRVEVVYERGGKLHKVAARAAVLAIGAWVAKHIVADLPATHRAAFDRHLYAPMLMASVALRNWRFLDKLGFSAARWFDGTGFYANVRKPMLWGDGPPAPFHPDKPIVMTLYAPLPRADLPLEAQGPDARAELYATPYAAYERRIAEQLQTMFGPGGFDARRDIAGIVLNRWGHAFVTPPPGFFFAPPGQIAPADIHKHGLDRIAFAPSADWIGSVAGGRRAVEQVLG